MRVQGGGATRTWIVPAEAKAIRLDAFLRRCLPHLSRQMLGRAISEGQFSAAGKILAKGARLYGGAEIVYRGSASWLSPAPPPNIEMEVPIVFEDEAMIVLEKPAGIPTHGFSGRDERTLANFLVAARPHLIGLGKSPWEAGLVHRLDRETSGLVVAAKTAAAYGNLTRQFHRCSVTKVYLALVEGSTTERGLIDLPLTHGGKNRSRMVPAGSPAASERKKWRAVTRYRKLAEAGGFTLLEIAMETGVTHQIRAHVAAMGHPIVGDTLYGRSGAEVLGLRRHFLHAWKLSLEHPGDGRRINLTSDLPGELQEVARRIGLKV